MPKTTFSTMIKGFGNNTGIEVPLESLEVLGKGKRPPVTVHVGHCSYKNTVGMMSGISLISLPKAHRDAAGLKAGDEVTVTLELDDGIREVEVPQSPQTALSKFFQN
jgi:antitoxin component of MazEF toxin-antitoxin module